MGAVKGTCWRKQLLATRGAVKLHEVKLLSDEKAFELFSWHAFKRKKS